MTVTEELVDWAGTVTAGALPGQVRAAALLHLLDGLGTAVAAARTGAAAPAVTVALGLGGPQEATVLGAPAGAPTDRVSAPAAALANGTSVHALDFDDTHAGGLVHATSVVLPAALAVGEQLAASGAEVLAAAVAGYETVTRLAAAVPHGFHARGVHATSAVGVLSAALVAARLMDLPPARAVSALGIAGSSSGGLLEFLHTGSSTKQLHPGLASHAGILAARLAAAGASGPPSAVEGKYGVLAVLTGAARVPEGAVTGTLGSEWEVTRITVKPYPACHLLRSCLDAAAQARAELLAAGGADLNDVVEVVATLPPESVPILCVPEDDKRRPRTPYEAKFSLPWSLAVMLLDGAVTVDTYAPARLARPDVLALAARVRHADAPFDGPAADAPATVLLQLAGGRTISATAAPSPASASAVVEKFLANCGGASATSRALADDVLGLAAAASLEALLLRTREVISCPP